MLVGISDNGEQGPDRMAETLKAQYDLRGGKKTYRKCSGNHSKKRGFCEEVLPENFGVPLEGDRDVGALWGRIKGAKYRFDLQYLTWDFS